MNQEQVAAALTELSASIAKVGVEIQANLDALATLQAGVKAIDDLNPDAPAPVEPGTGE